LAGGIDGGGYAYSATLAGASITWSGATFTLGDPRSLNGVSNATVTLPPGNFSKVNLLATGVNGSQVSQAFVINYTDGTSTTVQQSLSDWFYPQNYAGEATALTMAYRLAADGTPDSGPVDLGGYAFAINNTKTVKSIGLPNNRAVIVLAVTLIP
jgi:hypothetical protein